MNDVEGREESASSNAVSRSPWIGTNRVSESLGTVELEVEVF